MVGIFGACCCGATTFNSPIRMPTIVKPVREAPTIVSLQVWQVAQQVLRSNRMSFFTHLAVEGKPANHQVGARENIDRLHLI